MAERTALDQIREALIGKLYHTRFNHKILVTGINPDDEYLIRIYNLTLDKEGGADTKSLPRLIRKTERDLTPDEARNLAYFEMERVKESQLAKKTQPGFSDSFYPQDEGKPILDG